MEKDLNYIIQQTKQPLFLKNFLKWEIFQWDLHKWTQILEDETLEFRCGINAKTPDPQWERTTQTISGKFKDLVEFSDPQKWFYFDYKYLNEWFLNAKELREEIRFEDLGLQNVGADNSTIWMGTKGAHTPCHSDTYGCNVVVQLYGKKQWLLFPFNQDLKPTRIPYEESSIYSKLNFFSPINLTDFQDITDCRIVTLQPGDVLIVPHKWWHYVENLEFSISINTWLSLSQDDEERQNECLVQLLTGALIKTLGKDQQKIILNPNSDHLLDSNLDSGIELLNNLLEISTFKHCEEVHLVIEELIDKYDFIEKIQSSSKDLKIFLEQQSKRFSNNIETQLKKHITTEKLIHSITHPDVVKLIMSKLLE